MSAKGRKRKLIGYPLVGWRALSIYSLSLRLLRRVAHTRQTHTLKWLLLTRRLRGSFARKSGATSNRMLLSETAMNLPLAGHLLAATATLPLGCASRIFLVAAARRGFVAGSDFSAMAVSQHILASLLPTVCHVGRTFAAPALASVGPSLGCRRGRRAATVASPSGATPSPECPQRVESGHSLLSVGNG